MCVGLSALAAMGAAVDSRETDAQTATAPTAAGTLSQSKVFTPEQMQVRKLPNGGQSRDVLRGTLPTGEVVAVHESEQPAAATPNPPHTIQHSEIIVVIEGTMAFEHDGRSDKAGPGGVIFVAPGTLHTVKNVGDGAARYCVIQVGGDTKP